MIFLDPSSVSYTVPPPPKIYLATGFFLIGLDPTWTFPVLIQWDIDYRFTPNPLTISYTPWTYAGSAKQDLAFSFFNIGLANSYQFRYKVRTKNEISPFSELSSAGKVKVFRYNMDGTYSIVDS